MNPKHQQRLALDELDLTGVQQRLQEKEKFDLRRAETTIKLYRRFLKMIQGNPTDIMVPNEDVDSAWHHHILDTVKYAQDCQNLFGQFLHHNPNFYGTDAFFVACEKTQAIYTESFGDSESFLSTAAMQKPTACGGMLKDDHSPTACGGMLKNDLEMMQKSAACGGMLKDDTFSNTHTAACGGMLKDELDLTSLPAAALFKATDESAIH